MITLNTFFQFHGPQPFQLLSSPFHSLKDQRGLFTQHLHSVLQFSSLKLHLSQLAFLQQSILFTLLNSQQPRLQLSLQLLFWLQPSPFSFNFLSFPRRLQVHLIISSHLQEQQLERLQPWRLRIQHLPKPSTLFWSISSLASQELFR